MQHSIGYTHVHMGTHTRAHGNTSTLVRAHLCVYACAHLIVLGAPRSRTFRRWTSWGGPQAPRKCVLSAFHIFLCTEHLDLARLSLPIIAVGSGRR